MHIIYYIIMSVDELKKEIDTLPISDRSELLVYLKMKDLIENPEYRAKIAQRLEDMQAGKSISSEQVKEIDQVLSSKGL